jgi:hypothetical protein
MKKTTTDPLNNKTEVKQSIYIIIVLFIALMLGSFISNAQTIQKDANGNFYALKHSSSDSSKVTNTGKTFTNAKGEVNQVYQSVKGKLFVYRTSKAGNVYKQYLKID